MNIINNSNIYFIYVFLFFASLLIIYASHDYLYPGLISAECFVILCFNHFYNDYTIDNVKFNNSAYIKEVIELQWLFILMLLCHLKFYYITTK